MSTEIKCLEVTSSNFALTMPVAVNTETERITFEMSKQTYELIVMALQKVRVQVTMTSEE